MYISKLIDDPNDVTTDYDFADLLLTASGTHFLGQVVLCKQCGLQQVAWWMIVDTVASNGTTLTCTDLDQATTANLMVGLYVICEVGTDTDKYFTIATNTAAAPTVITTSVAPNADFDGLAIITNWVPTGYTAAS